MTALVDRLAEIQVETPALVLVPRRQVRHLNSQLDFSGDVVEVIVHPDDAAAAGVVDGEPLVVRGAQGELTGVAKVGRLRHARSKRARTQLPMRS